MVNEHKVPDARWQKFLATWDVRRDDLPYNCSVCGLLIDGPNHVRVAENVPGSGSVAAVVYGDCCKERMQHVS